MESIEEQHGHIACESPSGKVVALSLSIERNARTASPLDNGAMSGEPERHPSVPVVESMKVLGKISYILLYTLVDLYFFYAKVTYMIPQCIYMVGVAFSFGRCITLLCDSARCLQLVSVRSYQKPLLSWLIRNADKICIQGTFVTVHVASN